MSPKHYPSGPRCPKCERPLPKGDLFRSPSCNFCLFGAEVDRRKLSRSSDPWTSKAAASSVDLSRTLSDALERVRATPLSTASELGAEGVRKRLNDLRNLGLVRTGEPRRCRITGRMAQTWEVV